MIVAIFIFTLIVWTAVVIFATLIWAVVHMLHVDEKHRLCVFTAYRNGYDDAKMNKAPRSREAMLKMAGWKE